MVYIYSPKKSAGAFELVKGLNADRLRMFDGIDFWDKKQRHVLKDGDVVVCWGDTIPDIDGVRVLNSLEQPLTALTKYKKLLDAGLGTITLGRTKPTIHPILVSKASSALEAVYPGYYVQPERFSAEYRIHSFGRRSIGAGVKVPRDGFTSCNYEENWSPDAHLAHPWVRSHIGGWQTNYDFQSTPELRKLAHNAVTALELTFGAVDIGMGLNGRLKVIDVNTSPRIEGKTVAAYIRAITRWINLAAPAATVSPIALTAAAAGLPEPVAVPIVAPGDAQEGDFIQEGPYVAGGIRAGLVDGAIRFDEDENGVPDDRSLPEGANRLQEPIRVPFQNMAANWIFNEARRF